jgi:hypothetical protein
MKVVKKNKWHLSVVLILAALLCLAAGDQYTETARIKTRAGFITSDDLGNVFTVKDNRIEKYGPGGKKLHTYSNNYAGEITFADTRDPFKILLFYQDFGQVEFLDQSLSLSAGSVNLSNLGLELVSLACASYQGGFWVYDPLKAELIRVSQALEISERTGNLQQATGYSLNPNFMIERDNFIYLNNPGSGILIFDKYGSYYKIVPVKGLKSFQVFNHKIIFTENDQISMYDTRLNELNTAGLPLTGARSVAVCLSTRPQMLFMLAGDELFFFQIGEE